MNFKPIRKRNARAMKIREGITTGTEIWVMPKGAMPTHPLWHPTWLFYKQDPKYAIAERLVYEVFEVIAPDLCPPTYYLETKGAKASLMRWVGPNVATAKKALLRIRGYSALLSLSATLELAAIDVVDALTNNSDRHPGNVLLYKRHLIPIDHGLAFYTRRLSPDLIGRLSHNIRPQHVDAWRERVLFFLDIAEKRHLKLRRILNQHPIYKGTPLTKADVTWWVAKARKRLASPYAV